MLLNAIWHAFRREERWPSYRGIDQVLDRRGLRVRPLVESMPPGLMIPDRQRMSHVWFPSDNDELRVQIAGLSYCDDTADDLALVTRLVRYLADRERAYVMPSLSNPQPLIVTSEEMKNDLHLSDEDIARGWLLLTTFEWRVLDGGGGNPEEWSYQIDVEEVRHYRDVETVDDYLAARLEVDRPQLTALPPLPSFKAGLDVAGEREEEETHAEQSSPPWGTFDRPFRHPIVVAVVGTAVGGLLLTAILWAIHLL
jgi:hypothetical protein